MNVQEYFDFIVNRIHSVVFATVDGEQRPVTCAIDIMDYDESGLYFLTARGKSFYDRLKANENVAFTAIKGKDSLSCVAVSVRGKAKEIGPDRLPDLFCKTPIWIKFTPMSAPAVRSLCFKSIKESANGLTFPGFQLSGTAFPLAAHRRKKAVIL